MANVENGGVKFAVHPAVGSYNATAKSEFVSQIGFIDAALAQAIKNREVKLVDSEIYSSKALNSDTTVELMEAADQKKVGLRNLNKRQLESGKYFMVTAIQILSAEASEGNMDDEKLKGAIWKGISTSALRNGELEIKLGDKIFFPRNSLEMFCGTDERTGRDGFYRLECPKMLSPLTDITPMLWLASSDNKTGVKIVFHGVTIGG